MQIKTKNISSELNRLKIEMNAATSKNVDKESLKMIDDLRDKTPVKTGFAKSSWNRYKLQNGSVKIENTAPYIEYLNAGTSKQAPAFFVERVALSYGKPIGAIVNIKPNG